MCRATFDGGLTGVFFSVFRNPRLKPAPLVANVVEVPLAGLSEGFGGKCDRSVGGMGDVGRIGLDLAFKKPRLMMVWK